MGAVRSGGEEMAGPFGTGEVGDNKTYLGQREREGAVMSLFINETQARNAEAYAKIPATKPAGWKEGDLYTSAEGGFRAGDVVVIDNPDDYYHGREVRCGIVPSERTVDITIDGKTFRWCVVPSGGVIPR
jgi:hypothetical protein